MDDDLIDLLDDEDYEYKDVLFDGKPHCAAKLNGVWWLIPITFKFEAQVPYLSPSEGWATTEDVVSLLEPYNMLT